MNPKQNQSEDRQPQNDNRADANFPEIKQENLDQLAEEAEKNRGKKPGSQSDFNKQGNNGRGGGKS